MNERIAQRGASPRVITLVKVRKAHGTDPIDPPPVKGAHPAARELWAHPSRGTLSAVEHIRKSFGISRLEAHEFLSVQFGKRAA